MKIRYFSWLKEITENEYEVCNSKKIKDVIKLKEYLVKKYPELNNHFKEDLIRIAVNNEYIIENISLSKNDEIAFFPPVSSG